MPPDAGELRRHDCLYPRMSPLVTSCKYPRRSADEEACESNSSCHGAVKSASSSRCHTRVYVPGIPGSASVTSRPVMILERKSA
eukprot:6196897-Pleurochrysis_carterae.AAC.1